MDTNTKANSMTLYKIPEDEEIFVLRAQDMTSPGAVVGWIKDNINNPNMTNARLRDAFEVALRMREHRERRLPD